MLESSTVTVTAESPGGTAETTFEIIAQTPNITVAGDTATIIGTGDDDVFEVLLGDALHTVIISGTEFTFDPAVVSNFLIGSAGGNDSMNLVGTGADDVASSIDGDVKISSASYSVSAFGFDTTTIDGNSGNDTGQMFGSSSDDTFGGLDLDVTMTTPNSEMRMLGFGRIDAFGRGGQDYAALYGSQETDFYTSNEDHSFIESAISKNVVRGFARIDAFGRGGVDYSHILDATGDDIYYVFDTHSVLQSAGRTTFLKDFEFNTATSATGGNDTALLYATGELNHEFISLPGSAVIDNGVTRSNAVGFDAVTATSQGTGQNVARINEVLSTDTLFASGSDASMESRSLLILGFGEVIGEAEDGESPTVIAEEIDFTLSTIGDWII